MEASLAEPTSELIDRRIKAFEKFSEQDDLLKTSLDLIRLIFSIEFDPNPISQFTNVLVEFDPDFTSQPKAFQQKVLAAAFLSYLIDNDCSSLGIPVALAVVNCFGFGLREKPRRINIIKFAEDALGPRLMMFRDLNEIDPIELRPNLSDKLFKELISNPQSALTQPESAEKLKTWLKKLQEGLLEYSKTVNSAFDAVNRNTRILQEESDILWWIFSNSSRYFHQPWSQVKALRAPLVIGKELADLVKVTPGPRSSAELAKKVLTSCSGEIPESTTLSDILLETPETILKSMADVSASLISDITPIHYAISKFLQRKAKSEFNRMMKTSKVEIGYHLSPNNIMLQMYRECVYFQCLRDLGNEEESNG